MALVWAVISVSHKLVTDRERPRARSAALGAHPGSIGGTAVTVDSAIAILWLALGATGVSVVSRWVNRAAAFLKQREGHIRNAGLRDALEYATGEARLAAQTVVANLDQVLTSSLKEQGQWDAAAAASVKAEAMKLMDSVVSADARAVLDQSFADLPAFFSALIEEAVAHRSAS